jgi:hypothetical protein
MRIKPQDGVEAVGMKKGSGFKNTKDHMSAAGEQRPALTALHQCLVRG